jgi:hypothetical protein
MVPRQTWETFMAVPGSVLNFMGTPWSRRKGLRPPKLYGITVGYLA